MGTVTKDGTPVGGGEILTWLDKLAGRDKSLMDERLISLFDAIPFVKFIIYILLLAFMVFILLKMFDVKTVFRGKGIDAEIANIDKIKKRDAYIIRTNKWIAWITGIVQKSPFVQDKTTKEYMQYNLDRAGIKIPGNIRGIRAEEFNALIVATATLSCIVSILIAIMANITLGIVLFILVIIVATTVPTAVIRQIVRDKDFEIKENFIDYYLMLHYVLISDSNTPLSNVMRSYAKTTTSSEMIRLVDTCINLIDTHGEYEATNYIASAYREIHEVGKLMRLIRQSHEGGNVAQELMGFRRELLGGAHYAIEVRGKKLIEKANTSFNILMIVLFQAIVSALSIYIPDISIFKGLFS